MRRAPLFRIYFIEIGHLIFGISTVHGIWVSDSDFTEMWQTLLSAQASILSGRLTGPYGGREGSGGNLFTSSDAQYAD